MTGPRGREGIKQPELCLLQETWMNVLDLLLWVILRNIKNPEDRKGRSHRAASAQYLLRLFTVVQGAAATHTRTQNIVKSVEAASEQLLRVQLGAAGLIWGNLQCSNPIYCHITPQRAQPNPITSRITLWRCVSILFWQFVIFVADCVCVSIPWEMHKT